MAAFQVTAEGEIGETIKFEIAQDKLAQVRASMNSHFNLLRNCVVPRKDFGTLVISALLLKRPEPWNPKSRIATEWQALDSELTKMNDRYANELGENAYSVFNTMTEFASHPPVNQCVRRDRHSFQKLAGAWLISFTRECGKGDFSLARYLEDTALTESQLSDVSLN